MPTFNVGLNNQDVNTFKSALRDALRGDTIKESISNFRSLYEQLTESEVISEEELEEFENTFFTSDEIQSELKGAEKKVFDFMLSGNNIENPVIQDIFNRLGVTINKNLKYVDKPHMKGYHENRLIALYKSVLTHPDIISSVMLPIDFSYLKTDTVDLTKGFSGDTNVPFYHVSPIEDIQLMYDFRNGKAGVGQEANWMVDISRRGRLTLNNFKTNWFDRNTEEISGNELDDLSSIPSGVIRLDRQNYYNLPSKDLNEYREDMYNSFRSDGMTHEEAELEVDHLINEITDLKIGDGMTAILNAFVDIAKDPFITRANWVTTTTNPANFLLRLGLHPLYVNAFMAQPILRDYTNRINSIRPKKGMTREDTFLQLIAGEHLTSIFESESAPIDISLLGDLDVGLLYFNRAPDTQINYDVDIYGLPISDVNKTVFRPGNILSLLKVTKADPEYEAKREQATKLGEYLVDFHNSNYDTNSDVNIESLSLRELRNQVKSSNFDFNIQKSALLKFFEYRNVTTVLKDVMTVSKTDTDGVGDNILNMLAYNNIARGILDIGNNTSYKGPKIKGFESRFNKTPLGAYYRNLVSVFNVVKQNPELFNGANEHNINMINLVSTQLSGENIKDPELIRDIDNALYHSMMDSFFNLTANEKADLIKNTPARLLELKKLNPDNLFVRALTVETANVVAAGNVNKIISLSNLKRSPYEQDLLSSEWNRLFDENPELAEDLVKYSFVMSGFNITNGQFFTLIPHQYLLKKDINKHVRTYKASSDFIDRFIANNLDNANVTKHIGNFNRKPDMKGSGILSYTFMDNEVQKNYIKHGSAIYKKAYQEKGFSNTFVYVPIERTGIKVGKNVIPEYGNTVSSLIRTDKQRLLYDERMAKLDSILNTHSIVEVYQDTTFVDNIFDSNQFTERFRPDSVEVRSNNYLKSQAVFMTRDKLINTNRTTSEGTNNIFSNIFTGTEEKGKISLNRNNIPLRNIKSTLVNGFGDIIPVISNMEYAAKAYINWLTKGDNQHIPADKIQQYDELRETILNEVHNPESQLNQALDEGYKFVSPNDMLGGLKYTTHTDLLAQYMADFRQKRDYPMSEVTGQPITDIYGNQYSSDTEITTYESEVGPIRYVTNEEGNLMMLREDTSISYNQQQQAQQSKTTVKEGVFELFNENPELANIGTPGQYSQYLDTIFPESKVKNIVYRGKTENQTNKKSKELGIFFTDDKNASNIYAIKYKGDEFDDSIIQGIVNKFGLNPTIEQIKSEIAFFEEMGATKEQIEKDAKEFQKYILNNKGISEQAILNIKNPKNLTVKDWFDNYDNSSGLRENADGLLLKGGKQSDNRIYDAGENQIVVFEPEQIHILGSKQDVKGFKNYINSETRQPQSSKTRTIEEINNDRNRELEQAEKTWSENVDERGFPREALPPILKEINDRYDAELDQITSQQNQQAQQNNRQQQGEQTSLFDNMSATESEINNLVDDAIKKAIKSSGNGSQMIHQLTQFKSEALSAGLTVEEVNDYIKKCLN